MGYLNLIIKERKYRQDQATDRYLWEQEQRHRRDHDQTDRERNERREAEQ